jgi:hypothetical protein
MKTPESFMDYFSANYPGPHTVINNPDWHAPKIYRAAIDASAFADLLEALKAIIAEYWDCGEVDYNRKQNQTEKQRAYELGDLARAAIKKAEGK